MRATGALAALAGAFCCALTLSAQSATETFTATAAVRSGSSSASAPVVVGITRYSSAEERAMVTTAVREGGATALRKALAPLADAGFIQLGERRTPIKYAGVRPTGSGRLITVVTAEPMLFLGAGIPSAKPVAGFDVAVAMFEVMDGGGGTGDLSPAARVTIDQHGALVIEDYGATVIWLNGLTRGK
jgi:hypothetical protein